MQVLKFGGSSVANAQNIQAVINIIKEYEHIETIVVVSALYGVTDALLQVAETAVNNDEQYKKMLQQIVLQHEEAIATLITDDLSRNELLQLIKNTCNKIEDICNGVFLLGELPVRIKDNVLHIGEYLSSKIIAAACKNQGVDAGWVDATKLIITDANYGNANVNFIETNIKINTFFVKKTHLVNIVPGFIASTDEGFITTLGRGGSDYTAAIFAAAVNSSALFIYTDVSGMMTADPRVVQNVKEIPTISYQEAMELSHFGAKVIYLPTIQPVMSKNIPVWIKNTFAPQHPGTLIKNDVQDSTGVVKGISSIKNISFISLEGSGMVGIPGFSKRLFEALANKKINVILITQSSSEHSISVGIDAQLAATAKLAVDEAFAHEIALKIVDPLLVENNLAIVAIVGDNMKNHTGISGKMFNSLGKNGINIRAIAQGSSERNISAVIAIADVAKAVNVLHEEFFETTYKQIHIYIAGVGNVGSKLIAQLQQQHQFLKEKLRLHIKVVGILNSKSALINETGIDLQHWQTNLKEATTATAQQFTQTIIDKNLRNSIFIDVTATETVASLYNQLLRKNITVVACNKIACSASYNLYKQLKQSVQDYNSKFLFETNVGAGLPIIGTLNDLISSGDKIHSIKAVLSGTLNFVFNNYNGKKSFASVVKQAQAEGYTEPDPRLDLSGKDVMRKIMILARETGTVLEMEDINNESFMPTSCMQGSVEDFYEEMEKQEPHFKALYDAAEKNNTKLKFVASYDQKEDGFLASVGLQQINTTHDFYHLYGKDNIVLFYTNRYPLQPLIVKGAGAGAEVTASGVFADIIRATQR